MSLTEYDLFCVCSFRCLDDNIRTVVRGQTNVGQDGRQVSERTVWDYSSVCCYWLIFLETAPDCE